MSHHDPIAQRKEYFKVFGYLVALTILEVAFVALPLPKFIITLLVVVASCTKAGLVGYYYMHLKSETTWLKILACLPLIMFGYLAVLGPDSHQRPAHVYLPERPRVLPSSHGHGEEAHSVEHVAGEEAEKQLIENAEIRAKAEKSGVAPTTAAPAAGAAAAGGAAAGASQPGADDFR